MTKAQQTFKAKKTKKNRLSKEEYKKYTIYLADTFPICQMCNVLPSEDCHHLGYGSYGADKDDKSLIAVCRHCHEYAHKNKAETQELYADVVESNWREYDTTRN